MSFGLEQEIMMSCLELCKLKEKQLMVNFI